MDVPINKMSLYNQRNQDNIYSNNVFKDMCGNFFRVNNKGVIKQYDNPSDVSNNYDSRFETNNFTDLNTYDEFIVDNSYNFIKGTNIGDNSVTNEAHEGKYIFSNRLIKRKYEMDGSENIIGDCYTLKSGQTFSSEATYYNISSPFECKQLAIDNFYKHYIIQQDADGSLNCYLSNNENILNDYDVSANACINGSLFKTGQSINNSYGIYDNYEIGNKDNYRHGGYIDFDSNFVRKNQDFVIDNSNTYIINRRKFASLGSDVSCSVLNNDDTIFGFVQNISDNKCYSVNNDILMDPTQRIYDASYNIIMKNKKYMENKEGFTTKQITSNDLSKYNEVEIPTFTINDILSQLQAFPNIQNDIIAESNSITKNNQKIYKELEKYNKIIREGNLKLSNDISLNMNYVNNIEDYLDTSLNTSLNIENIQELKRKLEDEKLVLGFNHSNYILWTLLGIATLIILLKVSKPSNN
jgi:hypothetical protein